MHLKDAKTIVDCIHYQVQNNPDALVYEFYLDNKLNKQSITFKDLHFKIEVIASNLMQQGLKKGDRALLVYPPGLDLIICFFACLYVGVIAIPMYPPLNLKLAKKLFYIINDANPKIILSITKLKEPMSLCFNKLPKILQKPFAFIYQKLPTTLKKSVGSISTIILSNKVFFTDEFTQKLPYIKPTITETDLAFLQYTSGSTNKPKGVKLSHRNLVENIKIIAQQLEGIEHGVSWLPPYHDMGLIGGIIGPMYHGIPFKLLSPIHFLQKPWDWLKLADLKKTAIVAPNFAYEYCVKKITPTMREQLDLNELHMAWCGAEPVRIQTLEKFDDTFKSCGFRKEAFAPCYGLAEATLLISVNLNFSKEPYVEVLAADLQKNILTFKNPKDTNNNRKYIKIANTGFAFQQVAIVDPETLAKLSEDTIGEVWVRGECVSEGYWNNPEETEKVFHAKIRQDPSQEEYLRTGDLGFMHNNQLYIVGRIKDVIIIRGKNYYPQDLEYIIEQTDKKIRKNSLVAFSIEEETQENLIIVCETEKSKLINFEDLAKKIVNAIANEFHLSVEQIVFMPPKSLSKTTSGKVQRQFTKELFLKNKLQATYIWQRKLKVN